MHKTLLNHPLIDDYKAIRVNDYIAARRDLFAHLKEDFSSLEGFETIIVLSLSYPKEEVAFKGQGYGLVSRYCYGMDYHGVFQSLFNALKARFEEAGMRMLGRADIDPIDERFAGHLAGLGTLAKNQFLIHPRFGTYHFLGTLLIDAALETTPYPIDDCKTCTICIDACPTDALNDGFDKRLCTSYVTQAKIPFEAADIKPIKTKVFGCDICQQVCPKNQAIEPIFRTHFEPDENSQIHLESLLELSNKAIEKKYQAYAFAFRGGLVLKRNAFALLYNQQAYASLPLMKKVYETYKHVPWFKTTAETILAKMEAEL